MPKLLSILAACLVLGGLDSLAEAKTYYIDFDTGGDANSALAKESPWKRCPGMAGFAGAYQHQAGDVFVFKGGVTWPAAALPLAITNSGGDSADDEYTIDPSWYVGATWTPPILDRGGTVEDGITVNGSNLLISGFSIINGPDAGTYKSRSLVIRPPASNVVVSHIQASGFGNAIEFSGGTITTPGHDVTIEDCDFAMRHDYDVILIRPNFFNLTIQRNRIRHLYDHLDEKTNDGIHCENGPWPQEPGTLHHVTIAENDFSDNFGSKWQVMLNDVHHVAVQRNRFHGYFGGGGISVGNARSYPAHHITIDYNVFYDLRPQTWLPNISSANSEGFEWHASQGVSGAFYLTQTGGENPRSFLVNSEHTFNGTLLEDGRCLRKVSAPPLQAGAWCFGDFDSLGFSTLYMSPTSGSPASNGALYQSFSYPSFSAYIKTYGATEKGTSEDANAVRNNTFYGRRDSPTFTGCGLLAEKGLFFENSPGWQALNNIFVHLDLGAMVVNSPGSSVDHSVYYDDRVTFSGAAQTNAYAVDPMFRDALSFDFSLTLESPVPPVDGGVDWGQSADCAGTSKQGNAWDIGAYEYEPACAAVTCAAADDCHVAGTCDPATGACSSPSKPDGASCPGGSCRGGVCEPVVDICADVSCPPRDECHTAGTCDPATGQCSSPIQDDGTPCPGGACRAGVCENAGGNEEDDECNCASTTDSMAVQAACSGVPPAASGVALWVCAAWSILRRRSLAKRRGA